MSTELKNGHLVREHEPRPEVDPRQLELELEPVRVRATFFAMEVDGDDSTVAAAVELAAALIGGRHG